MITPPVQRPQCSSIILRKEISERMQANYSQLYQSEIHSFVSADFLDCDLSNVKDLLSEICSVKERDGFRIYLGVDSKTLLFLFRGIIGKKDDGGYYQISADGKSFDIVSDQDAEQYVKNYKSTILSSPVINKSLIKGNTTSYAFFGLLKKFCDEFSRQDIGSPIKKIRIKLSAHIKNRLHPTFKDRILVGFSFMEGNIERYLNDVGGIYGCDMPPEKFLNGVGADTGSPCPPKTNCPT